MSTIMPRQMRAIIDSKDLCRHSLQLAAWPTLMEWHANDSFGGNLSIALFMNTHFQDNDPDWLVLIHVNTWYIDGF